MVIHEPVQGVTVRAKGAGGGPCTAETVGQLSQALLDRYERDPVGTELAEAYLHVWDDWRERHETRMGYLGIAAGFGVSFVVGLGMAKAAESLFGLPMGSFESNLVVMSPTGLGMMVGSILGHRRGMDSACRTVAGDLSRLLAKTGAPAPA